MALTSVKAVVVAWELSESATTITVVNRVRGLTPQRNCTLEVVEAVEGVRWLRKQETG